MIKYTKTQKPDNIEEYFEKLTKAWQDNWIHSHNEYWYMIFQKKTTVTTKKIEWTETKEWIEFIRLYREINKNWTYDKTLLRKYEIILKENNHSDIIDNLKVYKEHLKLFPTKPPLQVSTYLNRNRFKDDWETVKINYEEKWITDIMKEREITDSYQDIIMTNVRMWRKSYEPVRQFTIGILDDMIQKYWIRKEI